MMLYEYFNRDEAFIKPCILVIDKSLLGFDENEDVIEGEFIKKCLCQYFNSHKSEGQIVIVDNLNAIPNMNFEADDIKATTYCKDEEDGHVYGFMINWRKDLPKESK